MMTVGTAFVMHDGHGSFPSNAWFARPLPAYPILFTTFFDSWTYLNNAKEVLFIESLHSILLVGIVGDVAKNTKHFASRAPAYLSVNGSRRLGFRLLQAGSALGLLGWIISFVVLLLWLGVVTDEVVSFKMMSSDWNFLVVMGFFRLMSCFFLWGGALLLDPLIFCPTERMIIGVTVMWTFAYLVDQLWRAYFNCQLTSEEKKPYEVPPEFRGP
jgi:hypothetical protein